MHRVSGRESKVEGDGRQPLSLSVKAAVHACRAVGPADVDDGGCERAFCLCPAAMQGACESQGRRIHFSRWKHDMARRYSLRKGGGACAVPSSVRASMSCHFTCRCKQ